jgi:hypothetical protein
LPDRFPQPIKTSAHGAIDYGFAAINLTAASMLGLSGPAALIPRSFALVQGGLNAVTRQPYAARPLVSLRAHRWIEAATIPALGALAAATGALGSPRGRLYFGAMGAALATVYALTDWDDPAGNGGDGLGERTGVTIGGDEERVGAFLRDPEAVRQFGADGWDGSFELRRRRVAAAPRSSPTVPATICGAPISSSRAVRSSPPRTASTAAAACSVPPFRTWTRAHEGDRLGGPGQGRLRRGPGSLDRGAARCRPQGHRDDDLRLRPPPLRRLRPGDGAR